MALLLVERLFLCPTAGTDHRRLPHTSQSQCHTAAVQKATGKLFMYVQATIDTQAFPLSWTSVCWSVCVLV